MPGFFIFSFALTKNGLMANINVLPALTNGMDPKFVKEMEERLKEQKTKLEAQLSEISTKNTKNPNDYNASFPDYGDAEDENAAEVTTFTNNLTLERTLESELRDVNKAMSSIAAGKYGVCKYCDKEIDKKRLEARPTSSSCIECKKRLTLEG
jgi:DnaK suppressor protein